MNSTEFMEVVHAFAVGALDPQERAEVESFLESDAADETCFRALWSAQETADAFARALPPVQPAPRVWQSIEDTLAGQTPASSSSQGPWVARVLPWAIAACAVLLVFFSQRRSEELTAELTRTQIQLEAYRSRSGLLVALLDSPESQLVHLAAQDGREFQAAAVVHWESHGAVLVGSSLVVPADKDLQLWVIRDGQKHSAGVLNVEADGTAIAQIDPALLRPGRPDAFAITLERVGGVPQPEGPIVLVGAPAKG